jgi:hypothetical protein
MLHKAILTLLAVFVVGLVGMTAASARGGSGGTAVGYLYPLSSHAFVLLPVAISDSPQTRSQQPRSAALPRWRFRGGGSDGGVEVTPMTISVRKNRSRAISMARKTKLAPKRDVVFDPVLNISHKIREVLLGYKSLPNYFIPIKIDRVD